MPDDSSSSTIRRLLSPIAQLREGETTTALLMFAYSFLAMTSYNIIQPVTRSKFISDLGAENLPYVQFASGLLIGVIMQGYMKATSLLPRRWVIPVSQAGLAAILVLFWVFFQTGQEWVSAAFYLLGLIFAILLVSQFWTLAERTPRLDSRSLGFFPSKNAEITRSPISRTSSSVSSASLSRCRRASSGTDSSACSICCRRLSALITQSSMCSATKGGCLAGAQ